MKIILIGIIVCLCMCIYFCYSKEKYSSASANNFNTFAEPDSQILEYVGGPLAVAQNNDLPLVADDQNPWFWSLDLKKPVYNIDV